MFCPLLYPLERGLIHERCQEMIVGRMSAEVGVFKENFTEEGAFMIGLGR